MRQLVMAMWMASLVRAADPAGIVVSVSGQANVARLAWIQAGSKIEVGEKSSVTVLLSSGRRFELGEKARVTVAADALNVSFGPVKELDRAAAIPKPAPIAGEHGDVAGAVRFRGDNPPKDLYPNSCAAVADKLTLRFSPVEGASQYNVAVMDDDENTVWSGQGTASIFVVPNLKPGMRYTWRVRAVGSGAVLGESVARFTTLDSSTSAGRDAFRASVSDSALRASVDLRLALFAEAADQFAAALREKPQDAEIERGLAAARAGRQ